MDQTVLKIALAGLLHDIGKFAQGNLEISPQYANDNADQYQPFYNGRHTHVHALYTAAFIEQFADSLPRQLNGADWGEGDSFINLAAGQTVRVVYALVAGDDEADFRANAALAWHRSVAAVAADWVVPDCGLTVAELYAIIGHRPGAWVRRTPWSLQVLAAEGRRRV